MINSNCGCGSAGVTLKCTLLYPQPTRAFSSPLIQGYLHLSDWQPSQMLALLNEGNCQQLFLSATRVEFISRANHRFDILVLHLWFWLWRSEVCDILTKCTHANEEGEYSHLPPGISSHQCITSRIITTCTLLFLFLISLCC